MAEAVFKALTSYRLPAGGGSETIKTSGVLEVNTTQAATGANTDETDLWSYTLPANTLNANGKAVRVTVYFENAANGNTKTMYVYFGGTKVMTLSSTYNDVEWRIEGEIIRTAAGAQLAVFSAQGAPGGLTTNLRTTPAEDETGAIVIKAAGDNGAASENDIVFRGAMVEYLDL